MVIEEETASISQKTFVTPIIRVDIKMGKLHRCQYRGNNINTNPGCSSTQEKELCIVKKEIMRHHLPSLSFTPHGTAAGRGGKKY